MAKNPLDSYRDVQKESLSGRELEASVLNKAATILAEVQQNWHAPDLTARLDFALRFNQQLWTLFQAEIMEESNPLPMEVKQNILALANFVDTRTYKVMADPSPEKLDMLIRINHNIAAGLVGNTEPTQSGQK
ncbi:flagellar protein FlaF [Sulfuritortus calidifontis]|uniref:Flagellar protein FlaF n=1 Tax=Sulfuritortus calidifontis TaxID=1914471 RepID=A0A4R3JSB7_9PROT|nr:flagellar biosynthesis regulator FlaF [Sulfuritortus calidifontis]TCS70128.1 flagellar protein FlaF [Sulfuritortus calidifontis]